MHEASEFVLYCVGIGVMVVSVAFAVRLVLNERRVPQRPAAVDPVTPVDDALGRRLRDFQEARFASPIIQRNQLHDDVRPPPIRSFKRQTFRPLPKNMPPLPKQAKDGPPKKD